jgi:hypothetical protein
VSEEMIKMKRRSFLPFVLALVCLTVWLASCTEEKKYDIVIGDAVCPEDPFEQDSATENFRDTVYVETSAAIDSTLQRNGYSRRDIKSAILNGGFYTVTDFTQPSGPNDDWVIGGAILIERLDDQDNVLDGPDTLISYKEQSVLAAWGVDVVAPLHSDGVDLINDGLADYLEPPYTAQLRFRLIVVNGDCEPNPSAGNRIQFEWLACLNVQLVGTRTTDVFDPF